MRETRISVLFLILVTFYFGSSNANNRQRNGEFIVSQSDPNVCQNCGNFIPQNGVNQGASTSNNVELNRCERCELQNYVNRLVFLMFAEDRYGSSDLMYMAYHRFEELEAFYNYVNSFIMIASFGNNLMYEMPEVDRILRLEFFDLMLEETITKIVQVTCTEHYRSNDIFYIYYPENDEIVVHEMKEENNQCLCEKSHCNRVKTDTLPLKVPSGLPRKPSMFTDSPIPGAKFYQIIPLKLITKFFVDWMSDNVRSPDDNFNGCLNILLSRLRHSVRKIITVSIVKSIGLPRVRDSSYVFINSENFALEALENSVSWLNGNTFIGPANRGPFNPKFHKKGDDELDAFDYEAEKILQKKHYYQLLNLFYSLQNFIKSAPHMAPFDKLIRGFRIYTEMMRIFTLNDVTPLNWNDWQSRHMLYEEFTNIRMSGDRLRLLLDKYFTTRKLNDRQKRSVLLQEIQTSISEEQSFKHEWKIFVSNLMKVSMDARSNNQSYPWMCKLSRLYNNYLFRYVNTSDDSCSDCIVFNEHLYSQILKPNNFSECNYAKNELCSAWHNIILNSQNEFSNVFNNKFMNQTKRKSYLKNIETVVNWLSSPVKIKEIKEIKEPKKPKQPGYQKPHENLAELVVKSSSADAALCLLWALAPSMTSFKRDCLKLR